MKTLSPFWFFLLFFAIRYPSIHSGLDILDPGYHLSNQLLASKLGWGYVAVAPFWPLSDFLGALWLKCAGGLWGAELGAVLLESLNVMVCVKALYIAARPHTGIGLGVVAASLGCQSYSVINYTNVPTLMFLLLTLFFLQLHKEPSRVVWQWLSGSALVAMVLSRITMLSFFAPLAIFTWMAWRRKERELLAAYGRMALVALAFFALWTWMIFHEGLASEFFSVRAPTDFHRADQLISLMVRQFLRKVPYLTLLFGPPAVVFILLRKQRESAIRWGGFVLAALLGASALGSFFVKEEGISSRLFPYFFNLIHSHTILGLLIVLVAVIQFLLMKNRTGIIHLILFVLSVYFPFAIMAGSGSGLPSMHVGLSLIGGFLVYQLLCVAEERRVRVPLYVINGLVLFLLAGVGLEYIYFYQRNERVDRTRFSTSPRSAQLAGVATTPGRAATLDAIIDQIGRFASRGDPIFVYHHIPMLHFASETVPFGNHSWIIQMQQEALVAKMEEFGRLSPPKLVVRCKTNPADSDWGDRSEKKGPGLQELEKKIRLIEKKMDELWTLSPVWENGDFELYTVEVRQ